jgi:hypothetical protein
VELEGIGTHADESIDFQWGTRNVELRISGRDPLGCDLVFKIKNLYEDIMQASMKKKDDKIVLRLTKAKELTWYSLTKVP